MKGNCGECDLRWACDIDPNKCNEWPDPATMTNAQKIRVMSDEELATFINRVVICHHLRNEGNCERCPIHPAKPCDTDGIVEWLQQPADEGTT